MNWEDNLVSNHYHIRWSRTSLDWERFGTQAEAEARASELAEPDEDYTIESFNRTCERCGMNQKQMATAAGKKI